MRSIKGWTVSWDWLEAPTDESKLGHDLTGIPPILRTPPPPHTTPTHLHYNLRFFYQLFTVCSLSCPFFCVCQRMIQLQGNSLRQDFLPESWADLLQRCYGCCVRVLFSAVVRRQFVLYGCMCRDVSFDTVKRKGWVLLLLFFWGVGVKLLSYNSLFYCLILLFTTCDDSDGK